MTSGPAEAIATCSVADPGDEVVVCGEVRENLTFDGRWRIPLDGNVWARHARRLEGRLCHRAGAGHRQDPVEPAAPDAAFPAERKRPYIDAGRLIGHNAGPRMAGVAQLVERQVVVLDAVGSSPIARPISRSMMPTRL